MTQSDQELIIDFWHQNIPEGVFRDHFSGDLTDPAMYAKQELAGVFQSKDGDSLESVLLLCSLLKIDLSESVQVLAKILIEDWHHKHEDIVSLFETYRDPQTIDALFETATKTFAYLGYDDTFGLARRCTWALSKIGTTGAINKLKQLLNSDNPLIVEYAKKRL